MRSIKLRYRYIIYSVFFICLFQGIISDYLGFHQINYVCDALIIFLFLVMLCRKQIRITRISKRMEYIPIIISILVVLVGWVMNSFSLPKAIWGVRNYARFFLFYILASACWIKKDVETAENIILKLFPYHIGVVFFQYIVEKINQDFLSGIFGRTGGGNGGLLIYLSIVLCIVICKFEYKKISTWKFIVYLLLMFVNAALSELKFFFILSIVILTWYLIMSRRKGRGMILAFFILIALYIGMQILYLVFPFWNQFFSVNNLINMVQGQKTYASGFDIGRTTIFSRLTPIISSWNGKRALFWGIGLGNGDYSDAFSFLNSNFYNIYGGLHYTWFSLGYLFVEVGYIGIISYISFFMILEIKAIVAYRKLKGNSYYNLLGTFFPVVFLMIIVYNSAMRSNYAYLPFLVLTWQSFFEER